MSLLVFMYHRVLPEPHPEAVDTALLQRQLDYLQSKFRMLTPAEVCAYLRDGVVPGRASAPCAALTFDDGWLDNLLYATPILKERGLSAMLAVSAGYLSDGPVRESESPEVLRRSMREAMQAAAAGDLRSYANRAELLAMRDSGVWSLEAHGTRHMLGARGKSVLCGPQGESPEEFAAALRTDVLNSRAKLKELTGKDGRVFFYPYGHYSNPAAEIVRECGYDIQFSVFKGACRPKDKRLVLPRIGVSRWKKFRKNSIVFGNPLLAALRKLFHAEKVCFDDFYPEAR